MLLVLMVVAVALPAVSFFAMHARMLDRQEVLSNNYAVRDGPVRYQFTPGRQSKIQTRLSRTRAN